MAMSPKIQKLVKDFFSKKMLIVFFLGFSNGIPFLLTSGTLKLWLARENVDITTIGYFSWVGLSYSLKFLWAPLLDRYTLFKAGRRRSWMLTAQVLLIFGILKLATLNPQFELQTMVMISEEIQSQNSNQLYLTDSITGFDADGNQVDSEGYYQLYIEIDEKDSYRVYTLSLFTLSSEKLLSWDVIKVVK